MEENKIIDINLAKVLRILKNDKKKTMITTFCFGVVGVLLAFGTPKVYKSTVVLAPEESGGGFSGSLSSLASMVGMNMKIGQTGDALYPEIYPDLMASTDFCVGLFPITVTKNKTGEQYTYQDYLQNHQKLAVSAYPMAMLTEWIESFSDDEKVDSTAHTTNTFRLTKEEDKVVKSIRNSVTCTVDKKTNVITIVVEDQDPLIAATIADSVQQHLQHAITEYRTKKAHIDLEYMKGLFEEARQQYAQASREYAEFADANQDVVLQSYRQKQDELENEMQLKYNIYQQVVEQLQLAKAKLQERTPAFTIVQGATVPIKHSSRPKIVSLAIWMFMGFSIRLFMLLWKNRRSFINI